MSLHVFQPVYFTIFFKSARTFKTCINATTLFQFNGPRINCFPTLIKKVKKFLVSLRNFVV